MPGPLPVVVKIYATEPQIQMSVEKASTILSKVLEQTVVSTDVKERASLTITEGELI